MGLGQKMSLATGQVPDKIYLPIWSFNLPWAWQGDDEDFMFFRRVKRF